MMRPDRQVGGHTTDRGAAPCRASRAPPDLGMQDLPGQTPPPRRSAVVGERVVGLADRLHRLVFGHGMSPDMARFLRNLSWSFAGGMVAAAIFFSFTVVAGRVLGPEE